MSNRHDKFKAYWEEFGKPRLEYANVEGMWRPGVWNPVQANSPSWDEYCEYRIEGDRHFDLRRKWIDSDKTLPIEYFDKYREKWFLIDTSESDIYWNQQDEYREEQVEDEVNPSDSGNQSSALNIQIGGEHYKSMKIQPVEFITANNLSFIQGSVIKYITRYKSKNGKQDLEKAKHFIDLLIELEYGKQ